MAKRQRQPETQADASDSNAQKRADVRAGTERSTSGTGPCPALLSVASAVVILVAAGGLLSAVNGSVRGWATLAAVTLIGLILGFWLKGWSFPLIFLLWGIMIGTLAATGRLHDSDTTEPGLVILFAVLYLPPGWLGAAAGLLLRNTIRTPPRRATNPLRRP